VEVRKFRELLAKESGDAIQVGIMVMKADGTQKKQLTSNGALNFAPYFHPNGKQIIFASNVYARIRVCRTSISFDQS
jgi:Tol biopolymer transport system component